jgi:hypothetical protein
MSSSSNDNNNAGENILDTIFAKDIEWTIGGADGQNVAESTKSYHDGSEASEEKV